MDEKHGSLQAAMHIQLRLMNKEQVKYNFNNKTVKFIKILTQSHTFRHNILT